MASTLASTTSSSEYIPSVDFDTDLFDDEISDNHGIVPTIFVSNKKATTASKSKSSSKSTKTKKTTATSTTKRSKSKCSKSNQSSIASFFEPVESKSTSSTFASTSPPTKPSPELWASLNPTTSKKRKTTKDKVSMRLQVKTTKGNHYASGAWTEEEHEALLRGLKEHGHEWKFFEELNLIPTRSREQIKSHAHQYLKKCENEGNKIPMRLQVKNNPYASGVWTEEEHEALLKGLKEHGRE